MRSLSESYLDCDGTYTEANRTNQASGRSVHIPAPRPSILARNAKALAGTLLIFGALLAGLGWLPELRVWP